MYSHLVLDITLFPFRDFQLCHQIVLLQRNHNKTELVWHTCSHFVSSRNWALQCLLMLVNVQLEAFALMVRLKWQCLCVRCLLCHSVLTFGNKKVVYNTGVSSFRRDDIILLRVEGQLVVAHGMFVCRCLCVCMQLVFYSLLEIGHNWGSAHDNPANGCGDQYLMHEFAHTGNNLDNFVSFNYQISNIFCSL